MSCIGFFLSAFMWWCCVRQIYIYKMYNQMNIGLIFQNVLKVERGDVDVHHFKYHLKVSQNNYCIILNLNRKIVAQQSQFGFVELYLNYQNQPIGYFPTNIMLAQYSQINLIKKIDNYVFYLNQKIGEGSFSQVFRGLNLNNNNNVAVKKIRTADIKSKIAKRLLDWEISILRNIEHPNIIKCLDIHNSVNNCYIITQLCTGGDMDTVIKKQKIINEEKAAKIIYSVYEALQYLYQRGIIHRDLKVSNIFIHEDQYKLGDFGFAIKSDKIFKDIAIGSPVYMSPQGLLSNLYGPKTDVWSFGILIYQLLHGVTPLACCKTEQQLRRKVLQEAAIDANISQDLQQLIRNCLKVNEKQRYSIKQIGQSTYIKRIKSQQENFNQIQKDLTITNASSFSTISDKNNLNLTEITYQAALSLMHYCRFINKLNSLNPSQIFSKYVILISTFLKKSKIYGKNLSEQKQRNLKQIIKQYNQNYINSYRTVKYIPDFINLQELILQCERLLILNPNHIINNLLKQTQLLQKCADYATIQLFSKKSKSKQYLSQIKQ